MSEDFKNKGYILHPAKGKIPFFCNFATLEDLEGAISKLNTLTPKVVDELPSVGEPGVLYFVRVVDASGEDQSKEYIYIEEEGRFELVGTTGVDLSDVVTLSADQVIEGKKTFSSSPIVPSPNSKEEVANKSYVDAAVDSVPVFSPEEAQTISGAYNFTDGLTRTTKATPANTDVMNKEMSDDAYVSKTGNSEVGGVKTFTEGITLADEAQLQLGAGTDAVKIHGMGSGKAVVEGTNVSELDFAVPVDLQETSKFEKLEKTIPEGTIDSATFFTVKTADNEMGFTWDVDGSVSFGNVTNTRSSWRVGTNGDFYIDSPLTVNSTATFSGPTTFSGPATFNQSINANGGIHIPDEVSTAQEAVSWNSLAEQEARFKWAELKKTSPLARPTWILDLATLQRDGKFGSLNTSNVSITGPTQVKDELIDTCYRFAVDSSIPQGTMSLGGIGTPPWKFAEYLANVYTLVHAAAIKWVIVNPQKVSVMLGSTTQGYNSDSVSSPCYSHPIHWASSRLTNYRYPASNSINGVSATNILQSFQVTYYGDTYLGSTKSCLLRGTDYGYAIGGQEYIWGLVPLEYGWNQRVLTAAPLPRQTDDRPQLSCRWALFFENKYVMSMTSGVAQTQPSITEKVKTYNVTSTLEVGIVKYGMRLDDGLLPGSTKAADLMQSVVMEDAVIKPIPTVTSSTTEVPAAGGEVTLTVSSTLAEAIYVLNDTMNGHDPSLVWCTQSAEELPVGTTEVTLTLAANTTGEAREVWAFVGHHYAQAAVVKINQLA